MTSNLEQEIREVLAKVDNEDQQPQDQVKIEDIYVLIVRETDTEAEDQSQIVESEPAKPSVSAKQPFDYVTLGIVLICCIPLLASILFQVYLLQNPAIATVTIIPKSQTLTLNGTLQLGRVLQPITISQSQTVPTTGRGHQDARAATGTVTFYNGQLNSIFIPAGLLLTGSDGVQIVTDQDASIPASNLPQVGQVTVHAHAINPGSKGNIAAYDINQGCCATAIKAVNSNSFYNGQDERNFQTVSKNDIDRAASPLKATLAQSMTGALEGQLKPLEQLSLLPCSPTLTPNQNVGDEAIQVKVTISETCTAAALNSNDLTMKAMQLLTSQEYKKLGSGYSLFGTANVSVIQATITPHLVFLSFKATGMWVYGLSSKAQELIKKEIEGKTRDQVLKILGAMPGIERGTISFTGFTDERRLPKSSYIHIILFVS